MKIVHIKPADGKCEDCGKVEELRPYGPGGTFVCFACMKKDEAGAKKRFGEMIDGANIVIINGRKI